VAIIAGRQAGRQLVGQEILLNSKFILSHICIESVFERSEDTFILPKVVCGLYWSDILARKAKYTVFIVLCRQ